MSRLLLLLFCMCLLSGCAAPLTSQEMMPQFDFYDELSANKFSNTIYVRNVEVSKGVGGASPVIAENYKAALVAAFRQADLYSKEEKAKYALDAVMTDMKQPFMGFNMTATATSDYTISKKSNDSVVFSENVSVPCTKTIGDAFDGAMRLRMASGCAVGENITHLIKVTARK